ncbi:hypothetical protein QVD17_01322 [Tagetes erecta]|uniref:Small auxin up regulated protein n=1 Tax=Tagetes erecta TaxID=13708 RepID=A0AAD8P888_TARER|nr:hypothetical protein QVD17_01322 [Tagetes erecta]
MINKLIRRISRSLLRSFASSATVPVGHLPVYVGEEMERFIVSTRLLNHPLFINLLNISAQEYGYHHKGGIRIPCHVMVFQRLIEALRVGVKEEGSCDLQHLLSQYNDGVS